MRLGEMSFPPERIICLTEETVETLYLLGEDARIVGVSGYAVRPPRVRREKPRVSAFISADIDKILALEPDLVLTFSDLQADIVAELIRRGVAVHAFNQRDLAGIFAMMRTLGALVGAGEKAERLCADPGGAEADVPGPHRGHVALDLGDERPFRDVAPELGGTGSKVPCGEPPEARVADRRRRAHADLRGARSERRRPRRRGPRPRCRCLPRSSGS